MILTTLPPGRFVARLAAAAAGDDEWSGYGALALLTLEPGGRVSQRRVLGDWSAVDDATFGDVLVVTPSTEGGAWGIEGTKNRVLAADGLRVRQQVVRGEQYYRPLFLDGDWKRFSSPRGENDFYGLASAYAPSLSFLCPLERAAVVLRMGGPPHVDVGRLFDDLGRTRPEVVIEIRRLRDELHDLAATTSRDRARRTEDDEKRDRLLSDLRRVGAADPGVRADTDAVIDVLETPGADASALTDEGATRIARAARDAVLAGTLPKDAYDALPIRLERVLARHQRGRAGGGSFERTDLLRRIRDAQRRRDLLGAIRQAAAAQGLALVADDALAAPKGWPVGILGRPGG